MSSLMRVRRAWGQIATIRSPAAAYTRVSGGHVGQTAAAGVGSRSMHAAAAATATAAVPASSISTGTHTRALHTPTAIGHGVRRVDRATGTAPGLQQQQQRAAAWARLALLRAFVARFSSSASGGGSAPPATTDGAEPPQSQQEQHAVSQPASGDDAIPLPSPPQPLPLPEHAEPVPGAVTATTGTTKGAADASSSGPGAPLADPIPSNEEVEAAAAAEAAEARAHAEAESASYAPIPTGQPDVELRGLEAAKKIAAEGGSDDDPAASLPKLPSSDTMIRGTLWFDNMYPMRVHWLDLRYLVATHNHDTIIPRVFAKAFGLNGFRLLGATPRANEGGVFVHFEVERQGNVRTPEDVTAAIIKLLRKNPVHARLTPKAVRCHLVRGSPFLDDMTSRFPYNKLKVEIRGPNTALFDVTVEQLYNELVPFGKIVDLTLGPFEKDKSRQAAIQFVRVFSAVGARNCLHRMRISVPLSVGSLPAMVPPKTDADQAAAAAAAADAGSQGGSSSGSSKLPPPPTADAYLFLHYDSILKTSVVTDFFKQHPRLAVPLLGLLFAAFTYLIFDPLRSWNITNFITGRFGLGELYAKLPWPFGWLQKQASELGNSSFFRSLSHGVGLDSSSSPSGPAVSTWSAREADEAKVRKWLNSSPDRILFLTGPKGAGKQALVQKLTSDRKNVVLVDVAHMMDRPDDEFIKALSAAVGFAPGFALITWSANIMDIFTPGASKASGSSTASSAQILKILECTSHALVRIASKENARRIKSQNQKIASMNRRKQQEDAKAQLAQADNAVKPVDAMAAKRATATLSATAAAMDSQQARADAAQESAASAPAIAEEQKKAQQSAKASTVSSLLGMMGGFSPTGTAAPAAKPEGGGGGGAAVSSASAQPNEKAAPVPINNNTEPLSRAPVVASSPAHVTSATAPVRLQDHSPEVEAAASTSIWSSSRNAAHMTEQQRNYDAFKTLQAQTAASRHPSPSSSSDGSEDGDDADVGKQLASPEPDNLPLFIIDGFNADNSSKHSNFLQVLVNWSAEMSAAGVARFIYLTDSALEESVAKQLPDVKLAEVVLSDATPEAAQQFLFASLPPHMRRAIPDKTTIDALKILGGRYNDLMQLVRGVENGAHPIETVEEIVISSMNSVKQMLFTEDKNVKWSKVHMWRTINMLVESPEGTVLYDDALFNIFSGDDTPLKALVRNDLLRVEPALSRGGDRLKAGSPVFLEAFRRLVHHQDKLRWGMDLMVAKEQTATEQKKIDAIEAELVRVAQALGEEEAFGKRQQQHAGARMHASWGSSGRAEKGASSPDSQRLQSDADAAKLFQRQSFLIQLLHDSHVKIAGYDAKRRQCEKEIKNIAKVS